MHVKPWNPAGSPQRCYLEGRRFTIVTDHKPNTYLDTASNIHTLKRRARWLEESSGYDYVWRFRKGRINVADPISRAPPQHFTFLCGVVPVQHPLVTTSVAPAGQAYHVFPGTTCQKRCTDCTPRSRSGTDSHFDGTVLAPVLPGDSLNTAATRNLRKRPGRFLEGGGDSPEIRKKLRSEGSTDKFDLPEQGQPLPARKEDVQQALDIIEKDFIRRVKSGYRHDSDLSKEFRDASKYRRDKDGLYWTADQQLVIPNHDGLREECLHSVHAHPYAGHYGINRTLKIAKQIYFWPGMRSTIEAFVRECDSCQRVQYVRQKPH
jgi:hypothetical protein